MNNVLVLLLVVVSKAISGGSCFTVSGGCVAGNDKKGVFPGYIGPGMGIPPAEITVGFHLPSGPVLRSGQKSSEQKIHFYGMTQAPLDTKRSGPNFTCILVPSCMHSAPCSSVVRWEVACICSW